MEKEIKDKTEYIRLAIVISNLVKSTLGPKGMNKMVVDEGSSKLLLTNDGATIIKNVKIDNPIGQVMKKLAISQESAVGDGTTTTIILVGQLLENALELINKGLHPTTIINGYNLARVEALRFINSVKVNGDREQIIKTCFGTKIPPNLVTILTKLLEKEDIKNLRVFKKDNSNINETSLYNGYVFEGFTINERMRNKVKGKIAVLDLKSNLSVDRINVTEAKELLNVERTIKDYMYKLVKKLKDSGVECVFYTDTNPVFETMLTNENISGIVVIKRDDLDWICKALNTKAIPDEDADFNEYVVDGEMIFEKNPNRVYVTSKNPSIKTLILCGETMHVLEEIERALDDVIRVLETSNEVVYGAGAIEIEIAKHIRNISQNIGGKEQIAFEKFAEAIESIPRIIAENAGLDGWEILTMLKTAHKDNPNMGVDVVRLIGDSKERQIVEPAIMKMHAISSAVDVANLILKLDQILIGEEKKDEKDNK